jgi:hypothetical protein
MFTPPVNVFTPLNVNTPLPFCTTEPPAPLTTPESTPMLPPEIVRAFA